MEISGPAILTSENVLLMCTNRIVRKALSQPLSIHKVIVEHEGFSSMENIFESIFTVIEYCEFCPTNVQVQEKYISFHVQRCRAALERLFLSGLVIRDGSKTLNLKVHLSYKQASSTGICPMQVVALLIEKRLKDSVLNLEAFSKDLTGSDIYASVANLKCIANYIHHYFSSNSSNNLIIKSLQKINTIKLSGNSIKCLHGIHFFPNFVNLTHLNLRNNLINNIHELHSLKSYNITELWLDGNPLCQNYSDGTSYIAAAKGYCANLIKLDGVLLKKCVPQSRRNFVCVNAAVKLIDQFMEHYFTVYDTCPRRHLLNLYNENALFSLSCTQPQALNTESFAINKYVPYSRNILKLSDISRGREQLIQGSHNICKFFESLPGTQHDPFTFTTDLVLHIREATILTITGKFREISGELNGSNVPLKHEKFYYFSRTFHMRHYGCDEFRITNEVLFICQCEPKQFVKTLPAKLSEFNSVYGLPTQQERSEMCKIMANITQMTESTCRKYLEDTQWNIKESINIFMQKYADASK